MDLNWAVIFPGLFAGTFAGAYIWCELWFLLIFLVFLFGVRCSQAPTSVVPEKCFICLTSRRVNLFPCLIASSQSSVRGIALVLRAKSLQTSSRATGTLDVMRSCARVSFEEPTGPSCGSNLWRLQHFECSCRFQMTISHLILCHFLWSFLPQTHLFKAHLTSYTESYLKK